VAALHQLDLDELEADYQKQLKAIEGKHFTADEVSDYESFVGDAFPLLLQLAKDLRDKYTKQDQLLLQAYDAADLTLTCESVETKEGRDTIEVIVLHTDGYHALEAFMDAFEAYCGVTSNDAGRTPTVGQGQSS